MSTKVYRRKPKLVEVLLYKEEENIFEAMSFCNGITYDGLSKYYYIQTVRGRHQLHYGDYIVRIEPGQFDVFREGTIKREYEEVESLDR